MLGLNAPLPAIRNMSARKNRCSLAIRKWPIAIGCPRIGPVCGVEAVAVAVTGTSIGSMMRERTAGAYGVAARQSTAFDARRSLVGDAFERHEPVAARPVVAADGHAPVGLGLQ